MPSVPESETPRFVESLTGISLEVRESKAEGVQSIEVVLRNVSERRVALYADFAPRHGRRTSHPGEIVLEVRDQVGQERGPQCLIRRAPPDAPVVLAAGETLSFRYDFECRYLRRPGRYDVTARFAGTGRMQPGHVEPPFPMVRGEVSSATVVVELD